MAESYILATDRVALAIREGRQTQDRRPIRNTRLAAFRYDRRTRRYRFLYSPLQRYESVTHDELVRRFAPWQPGDLLYVREAFFVDNVHMLTGPLPKEKPADLGGGIFYRADGTCCEQIPECECAEVGKPKWRPNIHMPKWAARTWVRVSRVWVERVRDISDADARAEGFEDWAEFGAWWANQYGGRVWFGNQFVWCCEFEREEQGR